MQYEEPLVSVIVTNYNNSKYICACLRRLWHQTYSHLEIIIVDDASTDNSRSRIEQFKRRHPNHANRSISTIYLRTNSGYANAVSEGLKHANGKLFAIQDGDDLSHKSRIKRQVHYLERHQNVDVLGTSYEAFESAHPQNRYHTTWLKYGGDIKTSYAKGRHCVCTGTILFRRRVYNSIGGFRSHMRGVEDYEFIARCIENGFCVENLPTVLYYYRLHKNQRSRTFFPSSSPKLSILHET